MILLGMTDYRVSTDNVAITVKCPICELVRDYMITKAQWDELHKPDRKLIQDILPRESAEFREALMTGLCEICFGPD